MYIYWDDEAFESIVLKEFSKLIKKKTFQYFSLILSYFESYNKCKHLHFPVLCRYKLLGFYFTSSKKKQPNLLFTLNWKIVSQFVCVKGWYFNGEKHTCLLKRTLWPMSRSVKCSFIINTKMFSAIKFLLHLKQRKENNEVQDNAICPQI